MKNLLFLLVFIPLVSFSQEPDKYVLYPTQNTWTFIKLDTSTGHMWKLQYHNGKRRYSGNEKNNLLTCLHPF